MVWISYKTTIMGTSKNHLIRNFLRNGRLRVKLLYNIDTRKYIICIINKLSTRTYGMSNTYILYICYLL